MVNYKPRTKSKLRLEILLFKKHFVSFRSFPLNRKCFELMDCMELIDYVKVIGQRTHIEVHLVMQ